MGKDATPKRRSRAAHGGKVHTRSFGCPDEVWREVEEFAARRGLASASDAARLLLRSGLHTERLVEEIAAAREWQIAEAWADAQAIAQGDRAVGSWEAIAQAAERARARIRERAAQQRAGA